MSTNVAPAEEKVRGRAGPGVGPSIPRRNGGEGRRGCWRGGGPKPPCPRRPGPPAPPGVTKTKKNDPGAGRGAGGLHRARVGQPPAPAAAALPSPRRPAPPPARPRPRAARRARPGASGAPGEKKKKNHLRLGGDQRRGEERAAPLLRGGSCTSSCSADAAVSWLRSRSGSAHFWVLCSSRVQVLVVLPGTSHGPAHRCRHAVDVVAPQQLDGSPFPALLVDSLAGYRRDAACAGPSAGAAGLHAWLVQQLHGRRVAEC